MAIIKIDREKLPKQPKLKYQTTSKVDKNKSIELSEEHAKSINDMSVDDIIEWCKNNSNI